MVFCDISFDNKDILTNNIIDIVDQEFNNFKIDYDFNFEKKSIKNLLSLKNIEFDQISLSFKSKGEIWIQKLNNSLPRICFNEIELIKIYFFNKKIEQNFSNQIVYGAICEELDRGLQNSDKKNNWNLFDKEIPSYAKIFPNPLYEEGKPGMDMIAKEFISIESLPGHYHLMNYSDMLWFGSCWQMYFSPIYYKYIPKPLFDDFDDCFENVILENGLRRILLHENIEDYDLPKNRAKQWAFRRALGIDSIAHELIKQGNRIEPENLPVLITKQNCKVGQTRVTRFLNANNQLISSDKAVKKEIKEYLEDGITVVFEKMGNA